MTFSFQEVLRRGPCRFKDILHIFFKCLLYFVDLVDSYKYKYHTLEIDEHFLQLNNM